MKLQSGDLLGPYRIDALLGKGGMGEVYRAFDPRLSREVAIKVISDEAVTVDHAARFEREARAIAAISHPNITAIYDVGEVNGMRYAVMELLDGDALATRMKAGPLRLQEALAIALQMAHGLAAAHEKGIVHRDLTPANVFILRDRRVKLLDFGLAKVALSGASELETVYTQAGFTVGTIPYMAPEQALAEPCDNRTDLFAFGAVLYEMLAGRRPFAGKSPAETLVAVVKDEPAIDRDVPAPEWVKAVIRRCLEKSPSARFQSAREIITAIESHSAPARSAEPEPPPIISSVVVLPFADMSKERDQQYLCEGIVEEIITGLSKVPGLRVVSRTSTLLFKDTSDLNTVGKMLNVQYALEGSARTAGNRLRLTARLTNIANGFLLWSETFERDLSDVFALEDEVARTVVERLPLQAKPQSERLIVSATKIPAAFKAYLRGRQAWAKRTQESLEEAVKHFNEAIAADPGYGPPYAGLADAYTMLAVYGLAEPSEVMTKAKVTALKTVELSPDLAEAHVSLGLVQALYEWAWRDAERSFRKAIALAPKDALTYQAFALNCLVPQGRFSEAARTVKQAVALDALLPPVSASIGVVYYFAGWFDESVKALEEALTYHDALEPAHFFLGLALAEAERFDDALHHAARAMELSGGSPETIAALGYIHAVAGHEDKARVQLQQLDRLGNSRYVSPGLAAQVHAGLGEHDTALECLERAFEMRATDLAWLRVRPVFARLLSNPDFQQLLRRLGLA